MMALTGGMTSCGNSGSGNIAISGGWRNILHLTLLAGTSRGPNGNRNKRVGDRDSVDTNSSVIKRF